MAIRFGQMAIGFAKVKFLHINEIIVIRILNRHA